MLSINHPAETFAWVRCLGSIDADLDVVETMQSYPVTTRWVVDATGQVRDVLAPRLAVDPRRLVQADVAAAGKTYNELVRALGARLPTLFMTSKNRGEDQAIAPQVAPDDGAG